MRYDAGYDDQPLKNDEEGVMSKSKGRNLNNRYSQHPGYRQDMGITRFQDFLFEINDRPERQRTDTEMSDEMHQEHPLGVIIHSDYREQRSVRTVRRRYNTGTQNHGPAKTLSLPYWSENGRRSRRAYPDPYVT